MAHHMVRLGALLLNGALFIVYCGIARIAPILNQSIVLHSLLLLDVLEVNNLVLYIDRERLHGTSLRICRIELVV